MLNARCQPLYTYISNTQTHQCGGDSYSVCVPISVSLTLTGSEFVFGAAVLLVHLHLIAVKTVAGITSETLPETEGETAGVRIASFK